MRWGSQHCTCRVPPSSSAGTVCAGRKPCRSRKQRQRQQAVEGGEPCSRAEGMGPGSVLHGLGLPPSGPRPQLSPLTPYWLGSLLGESKQRPI